MRSIVIGLKNVIICFCSNLLTQLQFFLGLSPSFCKSSWAAQKKWRYELIQGVKTRDRGESIILVAIRNPTWIEWAIFAAYKYYQLGYKPIVYYSFNDVDRFYGKNKYLFSRWFNFWELAIKTPFITFIDIESLALDTPPLVSKYVSIANDLAHTMAAYNLRVEEFEQDIFPQEYIEEYNKSKDILLRYCDALENSILSHGNTRIICPNGLIERSVIFYAISLKQPLNIVFVEGWARRLGHMIWNEKEPVMFYNIAAWAKKVGAWNEGMEKDYQAMLDFQNLREVKDDWLKGFIPVQRSKNNAEIPNEFKIFLERPGAVFLAGTNVIGDSATLRRGRVFRNQKEWLSKLITFFGENPNLKLVIRIHPDEILPKAVVKLGDYISPMISTYQNIFLFKADNDINTNTLIEYSDIGLAWVSNFGVDMVLHGKPTIIAGNSNYRDLQVGLYPDSEISYFDQIRQLGDDSTPPDAAMIIRAKIYQRIVFKEMSLESTSVSYNAKDYRLSNHNEPRDRTKFLKILCGEIDTFGE